MELFEQIRREYTHGVGTDSRGCKEVGSAPADGATGAGERGSSGAEAAGTPPPTAGPGEGLYRRDSPGGSAGATQAAAHGAANLATDSAGADRREGIELDGAALCAAATGGVGARGARDLRPAGLCLGQRGAPLQWVERTTCSQARATENAPQPSIP